MKRSELRKNVDYSLRGINGQTTYSRTERFSVSQAKAKFSQVLRSVQNGKSIIVTDHGKDIACIESAHEKHQLSIITPSVTFSTVKHVRVITPVRTPNQSILQILEEDRNKR